MYPGGNEHNARVLYIYMKKLGFFEVLECGKNNYIYFGECAKSILHNIDRYRYVSFYFCPQKQTVLVETLKLIYSLYFRD